MNRQWLYQWHLKWSLVLVFPVLGWCSTGLLYLLTHHFYPAQPAAQYALPTVVNLEGRLQPAHLVLAHHGIQEWVQLRWVTLHGAAYYQVQLDDQSTQYFDRQTGALLEQGAQLHAVQLARHMVGDTSIAVLRVEKRSSTEPSLYRVYFDRADEIVVDVNLHQERLVQLTTGGHRRAAWWKAQGQDWAFLDALPWLRSILLLVVGLLSLLVVGSGITLWWDKGWIKRPLQRWVGWGWTLWVLSLVVYKSYDLFGKGTTCGLPQEVAPLPHFETQQLERLPLLYATFNKRGVHQISLAQVEGRDYFRVDWSDAKTASSYFGVKDLQIISQGEERYALTLSKYFTQLPDAGVDSVRVRSWPSEREVHVIYYQIPEPYQVYVETASSAVVAVTCGAPSAAVPDAEVSIGQWLLEVVCWGSGILLSLGVLWWWGRDRREPL